MNWVKVIINYTNREERKYEDIIKDSIHLENGFLEMENIYHKFYYVNLANSIEITIE